MEFVDRPTLERFQKMLMNFLDHDWGSRNHRRHIANGLCVAVVDYVLRYTECTKKNRLFIAFNTTKCLESGSDDDNDDDGDGGGDYDDERDCNSVRNALASFAGPFAALGCEIINTGALNACMQNS